MNERLYDNKTIRKEIYFLIIPVILENIFQMSAGLVSAAMIGRLTPTLISAQGISARVTGVLWCLFKGIGIGATVLIAKTYGEGDVAKCKKTFELSALTGVIISFITVIVVLFNIKNIVAFFTPVEDTMYNASKYLKIVIFTSPFVLIMATVTGVYQGHGNTKTPMFISIVVNIINVILGYLLIYGKFGLPRLELVGAGIALLLSQASGAFLGLFLLYNKQIGFFSTYENENIFKLDFSIIKEVYSIGIPAAFENMFWQLSAVIMSKIILSYGEITFSAYQLGLQAEMLSEMPAVGVGIAATSLTANAIGSKDEKLLKAYTKQLLKTAALISGISSLLIIFFPGAFMNLFTNIQEIKAIGMKYLIAMGFIQIPQNLSKVLNGAIRSAGYKNTPMLISFFGIWVVRIPLALLFAYVLKLNIIFIWICMDIDQITKCIISAVVFKIKKINTIPQIQEA
ncbi:MAG: MATE family efflux transporter [Tissierellia bacterium]|nr:MATE family efflux transporter [Tissierellia bacterium]